MESKRKKAACLGGGLLTIGQKEANRKMVYKLKESEVKKDMVAYKTTIKKKHII